MIYQDDLLTWESASRGAVIALLLPFAVLDAPLLAHFRSAFSVSIHTLIRHSSFKNFTKTADIYGALTAKQGSLSRQQ